MKKPILILISACLIIAFVIAAWFAYGFLFKPLSVHTQGQPSILVVDKHSSAQTFVNHPIIAAALPPRLLLWFIRVNGYANQLKAGVYDIKPGETGFHLMMRVVRGDVWVVPFRIIEGMTFYKVNGQLLQQPYLKTTAQDWNLILDGHLSPEGLLLADTYHYHAGSQAAALLKTAHQKLTQFLDAAWASRDPDLPYKTPYELLIAASIIEKETALLEEKHLISGVIVNRLKKRMPLQMDPTVIYALGPDFQGRLKHGDLSVDSPYNTYKHYGLPPTPIAMVGKAAIDAAAHPSITPYLYFVACGNGHHRFSETYDAQRRAIQGARCTEL